MSPADLRSHARQELEDILILIERAREVETRARTLYYKMAFICAASVMESFMYRIVQGACGMDPALLGEYYEHEFTEISNVKLKLGKKLYLSSKVKKRGELVFITKKLNRMNRFCRANKLITPAFFKRVDRVRIKRNHIHLYLRDSTARSYRYSDVDRVLSICTKLLDILDSSYPEF